MEQIIDTDERLVVLAVVENDGAYIALDESYIEHLDTFEPRELAIEEKVWIIQYLSDVKMVSGEKYDDPYIDVRGFGDTLEEAVEMIINNDRELIATIYPPSIDELNTLDEYVDFFKKDQKDFIDNIIVIDTDEMWDRLQTEKCIKLGTQSISRK